MCPAGPHECVNLIAKLQQNLKFVVCCKNVVEPKRHLHVQLTITVLNTIYSLKMGGKCLPKRREAQLYLVQNTIKTLKELRTLKRQDICFLTIYRLQGMKQISETRKCGMKREQ